MSATWIAVLLGVLCVLAAGGWYYLFVWRKRALMTRMQRGVEQVILSAYVHLVLAFGGRYSKHHGQMLAAAVVNELFSREPSMRNAMNFRERHAQSIQDEIARLRDDSDLRHVVTEAIRIQAVLWSAAGRPEQGLLLVQKLADLGILLPGGEASEPMSFLALAREFEARTHEEASAAGLL